jgi:hypothetical protein
MKLNTLIALVGFFPALVLAQNAPNMIGTWTGTFNAAVMGSAAHHVLPNKRIRKFTLIKYHLLLILTAKMESTFLDH